jgi:hypothetical protein
MEAVIRKNFLDFWEANGYPVEGLLDSSTGNKVGWLYYDTRENAIKAAAVARLEATAKEAQGYDFGYSIPGEVAEVEVGQDFRPVWRVTIP